MKKILIIQTAFIGDVVLATVLIEKLHQFYPLADIDFILRKGNENLLANNPKIHDVIVWDKRTEKIKNLLKLILKIRKTNYDLAINVQRFFSTGILMLFAKARIKSGFDKNPLSFCYHKKIKHTIGDGRHEVERNLELIKDFTNSEILRPVIYPSTYDFSNISKYQHSPYVCISPTSVWYTKQYPQSKWAELIHLLDKQYTIYLLGGVNDYNNCELLKEAVDKRNVINLCGKLSFLESAAIMKNADMNFVNDSAPLHLASAMNAKTTAVFCSTIPGFGFGPLADSAKVVQVRDELLCRPCGLHGLSNCPKTHFKCAMDIQTNDLLF